MNDMFKAREAEIIALVQETGAELERVKSRLETDAARILGIPMPSMRAQKPQPDAFY